MREKRELSVVLKHLLLLIYFLTTLHFYCELEERQRK